LPEFLAYHETLNIVQTTKTNFTRNRNAVFIPLTDPFLWSSYSHTLPSSTDQIVVGVGIAIRSFSSKFLFKTPGEKVAFEVAFGSRL
jgi:hypothetical protein